MTTAEMLRTEGRTKGRAEGRAEALVQVLTVKFGPLPESVPETVTVPPVTRYRPGRPAR